MRYGLENLDFIAILSLSSRIRTPESLERFNDILRLQALSLRFFVVVRGRVRPHEVRFAKASFSCVFGLNSVNLGSRHLEHFKDILHPQDFWSRFFFKIFRVSCVVPRILRGCNLQAMFVGIRILRSKLCERSEQKELKYVSTLTSIYFLKVFRLQFADIHRLG